MFSEDDRPDLEELSIALRHVQAMDPPGVGAQSVAECLRQAGDDVLVVATYLSGSLTQRRTGVGWRSLTDLPPPAEEPSLTVAAVDAAFAESDRPAILIADTIKGKGVDFMENQPKWHYGALDSEMYARAQASVRALYEGSGG